MCGDMLVNMTPRATATRKEPCRFSPTAYRTEQLILNPSSLFRPVFIFIYLKFIKIASRDRMHDCFPPYWTPWNSILCLHFSSFDVWYPTMFYLLLPAMPTSLASGLRIWLRGWCFSFVDIKLLFLATEFHGRDILASRKTQIIRTCADPSNQFIE